ncbi:hypothetical protein BHM03_00027977 [Ensete ventricosum]|nr:hypothetical protein BHM03_00027977 [Ensete ventricosum]
MVSAEGERKKKREKKNLESHCSSPVLSIARTIRHPQAISSPRAGRRNVSPCEEKERGDKWGDEKRIGSRKTDSLVGNLIKSLQKLFLLLPKIGDTYR